ncbi:uncharacterized protein LOC132314255 [Cornus florida]|uniref:uncharacterized protein LOC132314255 n=1 Tax=Cornus florida TaxID=4283 RepID=UPI0028A2A89B|nr:uncharacterized protein LOC132314255 [Cornus florida]
MKASYARVYVTRSFELFILSLTGTVVISVTGFSPSAMIQNRSNNLEVAKLLVAKDQHLPNIADIEDEFLPLHVAAVLGHKNMVHYLMGVTSSQEDNIEDHGPAFVAFLINSGLYDIALLFLQRYGALIARETKMHVSLLQLIAMQNSAFKSGTKFNFWQTLIYFCVPTKLEESTYHCSCGDVENPTHCCISGTMKQKLLGVFWKVAEMLVPRIKHVRGIKWKHDHAIQLVRHLCMEYEKLDFSEARQRVGRSVIAATTSGIPEVIEEIVSTFPEAIYSKNEEGQNLFHIAILNRQRKAFKRIYQLSDKPVINNLLTLPDSLGNTNLDLVAYLKEEQSSKLKADATGAALQMQLELQWFKG